MPTLASPSPLHVSQSDADLERLLSEPTPGALATVGRLAGDYVVLGAGGKMGASTAVMLRRALDSIGKRNTKVLAVSRYSRRSSRDVLEELGVSTIACDLANPDEVARLPLVENALFLAGQKFGTDGAPGETWVQNTFTPALAARHYRASRIVAFSTGCVYPFTSTDGPGCSESTPVAFNGDYASSCVGRERVFSHYSETFGTRVVQFRLNYAVEYRYGVIVDIALKVLRGDLVDVTTGHFNCIWQSDACARAIQCLEHASSPARVLNISSQGALTVRAVATRLGELLDRPVRFTGKESDTAWIADASESIRLFGPPTVSFDEIIARVAAHVRDGGLLLGKPTQFERRDGRF